MAVFEIISNPVDTQESLQNLCQYILDPLHEKSYGTLIGGQYVNPASSFEEMREVQTLFDKDSGRLAYHFIISFDPGDPLMPEDAFTFAIEFIDFFFKNCVTAIFSNEIYKLKSVSLLKNSFEKIYYL